MGLRPARSIIASSVPDPRIVQSPGASRIASPNPMPGDGTHDHLVNLLHGGGEVSLSEDEVDRSGFLRWYVDNSPVRFLGPTLGLGH